MATDPWAEFLPGKVADPWAEFMPAKERKWSDVPGEALANAPASLGNFAHAVVQPILHPIDTAQALGDLAVGAVGKAVLPIRATLRGMVGATPDNPEETKQLTAPADQAVQFLRDRYGSEDALKRTLATDPVGAAADLASILMPAAKVPGVATATRVASPINAATETARLAGRLAEPVVSNTLGLTTGAGVDAVREAAKAGAQGNRAFVENMRGNVPMTDVLDQAKGALRDLREERNTAYSTGMADVRKDATVLALDNIEAALGKTEGIGSFEGKTVNAAAVNTREKLAALLSDWKASDPATYHTPGGLDALKQAVGAVREETAPHTQSRVVADRVYRAVGDTIKEQAPTYAGTMGDYAAASSQINEIEKAFSLGERAAQDTGLRKLQSVMRNNVNTNFGNRERLAEALAARAPDLKASIAGQSMNSALPRGIAKLGPWATASAAYGVNPVALAMLPLESPRLVGEALYATGRAAGATANAAKRVGFPNLRNAENPAFQAGRVSDEEKKRRLYEALTQGAH